MALINCPECGKQISDKATCCPDCGFPMNTVNDVNYDKASINKNQQLNLNSIEIEVKRLIDNGEVIAAVKYYKDNMNCGLKEAKDKVDSLRGITPSQNNRGCASIILVFIIVTGALFCIFR